MTLMTSLRALDADHDAARAVSAFPTGPADVPSDGSDGVVTALGALLDYDVAVLVDPRAGDQPVRLWSRPGAVLEGAPVTSPAWMRPLVTDAWRDQRTTWRAIGPGLGRCVAVPVGGEQPSGVLVYHGASMRQGDATVEPLLDVVAQLLSESLLRASETPAGRAEVAVAAPGTVEDLSRDDDRSPQRAMALVDVFAFTVTVVDGEVEWKYFGPNSATVFGHSLSKSQSLPELIRTYTHPDDEGTAEAFVNAVAHAMRAEVELRLLGDDGLDRWVSWRAVPRTVGDQIYIDGVATDVSARHSLGRSRRELAEARRLYSQEVDVRREHARAVRDANDNVLQRLFATGLRLQALQRRLDDTEAHAASAIAFQLDQAVSDLREVILNLNGVVENVGGPAPLR